MLAKASVLWTEFLYAQEMQFDSLLHFWDCLKRWWVYRPRIVRCAFCGKRMWENGKGVPKYCSSDCVWHDEMPQEEDELPF